MREFAFAPDKASEPLDREGVVAKLRALPGNGDIELAHVDADDLLVAFIRSLGFDDVADAWDGVPKWYA